MSPLRSLRYLALPILALPGYGLAQPAAATNTSNESLHVLRTLLHAELDKAELCLEFDHALAPLGKYKDGTALRLETKGKNILSAAAIPNVTGALLCLPPLEYEQDYKLAITDLRGANNEKLESTYSLSLTTPRRRASLAIAGDGGSDDMARWQGEAPMLRAVNVPDAHVELYRITDMDAAVEAWSHRMQTTLAPSESIYFARHKGERVAETDTHFNTADNLNVEVKPDVAPQATTGRGLYLIAATTPTVPATKSESAKTETAEPGLAPQAAKWFLNSALRARAEKTQQGFYVFTEKNSAAENWVSVAITLMDSNRQAIAQAESDAHGTAFIALDQDKMNKAAIAVAHTKDGDFDFIDLTRDAHTAPTLRSVEAEMDILRRLFAPGEEIDLPLSIHDLHNKQPTLKGSAIIVLRADNSVYQRIPVPDMTGERLSLPVTMPTAGGEWRINWVDASGTVLHSRNIRVVANPDAPIISMAADRKMVSDVESAANITINAATNHNKAVSFLSGRVTAKWISTSNLFSGWDDYRFGVPEGDIAAPPLESHFITDENGVAHLRIDLVPPKNLPPASAAVLDVQTDPAMGIAAKTQAIILPMKPRDFVIGIKPLAASGFFAENSVARFAVVALDSEGRRRNVNNISYQIYNEGRSFDWYASDGTWNYKPLQQLRRLGGKALSLGADNDDVIEWPVTAGTYRIDITDADGKIVARTNFSAGWGLPQESETPGGTIALDATPTNPHAGTPITIHFKLDDAAMITASITDDHVRQILHEPMKAGDNSFSFTPAADWGNRLLVRVENSSKGGTGEITLSAPRTTIAPDKDIKADIDISGKVPAKMMEGDSARVTLAVMNGKTKSATYHYTLSGEGGLKITGNTSGTLAATAKSQYVYFVLSAAQTGAGNVVMDITDPQGRHDIHRWPVTVHTMMRGEKSVTTEELAPKQSLTLKAEPNDNSTQRITFIAATPVYDTPRLLADVIANPAPSVADAARRLGLLQHWRDTIAKSGLMNEALIAATENRLITRLLLAQNTDGSFSGINGTGGDLIQTSTALVALAQTNHAGAAQATAQAEQWLAHRLENTWFDESERPARAAVYAALARAGKLDVASLHYFSDTSSDKNLSPLAAVQLAYAFASLNDRDKAGFWLAQSKVQKGGTDTASAMLPLLLDGHLWDSEDAQPALQKLSATLSGGTVTLNDDTDFLMAMATVQERGGQWRYTHNGVVKTTSGIMAFVAPNKAGEKPITIQNPGTKPLVIANLSINTKAEAKASTANISRRLYTVDGTAIGDMNNLAKDANYVVVLEGGSDDADKPRTQIVHETSSPALTPLGCTLSGTSDAMGWMRSLNLTTGISCTKSFDALDTTITTEAHGTWRIAYFAHAEWTGIFTPASASAYSGGELVAKERARAKISVK